MEMIQDSKKKEHTFTIHRGLLFAFVLFTILPVIYNFYSQNLAATSQREDISLFFTLGYLGVESSILFIALYVFIVAILYLLVSGEEKTTSLAFIFAAGASTLAAQAPVAKEAITDGAVVSDSIAVAWLTFAFLSIFLILIGTVLNLFLFAVPYLWTRLRWSLFGTILAVLFAITILSGRGFVRSIVLASDVRTFVLPPAAEMLPLIALLAAAFLLFPILYKYWPNRFTYALILSAFPFLVANSYMLFASSSVGDGYFYVAQLFKLIAFLVPAIGLSTELVKSGLLIREDLGQARLVQAEYFKRQKDLRKQSKVIVKLAQHRVGVSRDLNSSLQDIAESAAMTLDVDRVAVWLKRREDGALSSAEVFDRQKQRHRKEESADQEAGVSIIRCMSDERILCAPNASKDSRLAEMFDGYITPSKIQALIAAPVRVGGNLVGVVSFECTREKRDWGTDDEHFARAIGDLIGAVYQTAQRKLAEDELQFRSEFENLLLNLANKFVNISAEETDQAINDALRAIGEFAGIDRSYLYIFNPDRETVSNTHEWCAPGILSMRAARQMLPVTESPWSMQKILKQEIAYMPDTMALPKEAEADSRIFRERGVRALIWVPAVRRNEVLGFAGFTCVRTTKEWSTENIALLKIVSEMFVNALERKAFVEALKESEARFQAIADEAPVMIVLSDPKGDAFYFNKTWLALTGRSRERQLGDAWLEGIHSDDRERVRSEFRENIPNKQAFRVEYRLDAADRLYRNILHQVYPRWAPNGELIGFIGSAVDVTDQKQAEEERRKLETHMRHVQNLEGLGVLAGGVAHDFNNLLMGILGNAGLAIMELPEGAPAIKRVEQIKKIAERAADLTNQLLAYSGKGKFIVGPLNLTKLVEEMAKLLETVISKNAVLHFDFPPDVPQIEADATQLRQVVMNLITNASDSLEGKEGTISVSTGHFFADAKYLSSTYLNERLPQGWYVYLEVADTGCGMEAATIERIFDPFFSTKFKGRGLGLAAVLGIVRSHRGALRVSSEAGRGTIFRIMFPRLEDAKEESANDSQGRETISCLKGCILVVDDEETSLEVAKEILQRYGLEVVTAENGRDALDIYSRRAAEISAVLLDMTMPGMDGEETFRRLKEIRSDVKVVLVSGYSELEVKDRFSGKSIAAFLQKPFGPAVLAETMKKVLSE